MERADNNNINIGIPLPLPISTTNMNSSSSASLGLDMHLNSQHLSFNQIPTGPIRHQRSSSSFSPYPSALPRRTLDSDEPNKQPNQQQQSNNNNCPWARMKWTEAMVRLLISEVYRVGDDGGGTDAGDHHGKGSASRTGAAKGKWKSVSKAMIDKGYYVSPQQCEDKFNDLNKRYKRVIDLLGKGTACRVVENPNLLDSMENLLPKAKEEARKLLNSKHLFFPEMCAYHNAGHPSSSHTNNMPLDQQQCMHTGTGETVPSAHPLQSNNPARVSPQSDDEENQDNSSDNESNDSSDKEDDYDTDYYGGEGTNKKRRVGKHAANSPPLSLSLSSTSGGGTAVQQLKNELMGVISSGDGVKQWIKRRAADLEEQRVGYQCRAYQLEKQSFKWLRYRTNKEREMERQRLQNERLKLENERMLLLLRQKEMEFNGNENFGTGVGTGTGALGSSTEQLQFQQQQGYMQHK